METKRKKGGTRASPKKLRKSRGRHLRPEGRSEKLRIKRTISPSPNGRRYQA